MNFTYFVPDTALQTESRKWEVFRIQMCELGSGIALLPVAIAHGNPRLRLVRENCPSVNTELWFVSRLDMRAQWQLDFADMLQAELVTWAH